MDIEKTENFLKSKYKRTQFTGADEDIWPPAKPKFFTNITLVHHKTKQKSKKEIHAMAKYRSRGDVNTMSRLPDSQTRLLSLRRSMWHHSMGVADEYLACNKISKNIEEIFRPLNADEISPSQQFVLIEGVPGIGKTYLCKEIAYQWSQGKVLTETKLLFLLLACEQMIQSLKQVKDMVRHCCHLESEETVEQLLPFYWMDMMNCQRSFQLIIRSLT